MGDNHLPRRPIRALPALLVASITLVLCLTLGTGQEVRASSTGPGGESRSVLALQASSVVGDVDCSTVVNTVDALKLLRHTIHLSVFQQEPCDDIGSGGPPVQGDVDCNGSVTLVDSLKILRYVAGLSVSQQVGCPPIGTGGG